MKVLGYRYGVCHRSLQQALRTLTKEGVLDRNGRAYRVVRTSTHSSSTLVCIVDANYAGATPGFQASRRYSEFIRTLEQRCRRHNLRFRLLPFGNQWRTIPAAVGSIRTPLGAVVYLSDAISAHLSELMSGIGAHARSLVVYDDDCANIASSVFPASARCTHYTSSAGSAGGHMGRYLAEMGHRRVVFFSAFHDRAWSRHRFESLRKAMQSAGCQLPEAFAVESADEELGAATAATELLVLQVKRIGTQVTRLLGTDHLAVRDQGLLQNIIRHNMEMDVLRERLYPLFARALKETDATVWVGANDKTALLALEYLREHQVEVPRTISVVGFDDILESMSAQLTTYNFDVSSAARAAFDFIAFPRERTVRHALRREEIEGVVVPRGSVRRSGEGL
jgi:DNA-binding LacI/PurR family transcriptional regulator